MFKRKIEVSHDRYAASAHVCQLIAATLKISITKIEVPDTGRGYACNLATGIKPVQENRPNYRRTEGGFEEINISVEPE
jgi:hypothetical protein